MPTPSGKMTSRKKQPNETPYTRPTTTKKDRSHHLYEFYKLFYGAEGNPTCRWTRSTANEKGLTRSCYIAQRLFMIRYVLQTYFDYNYREHSLFENKIFELTNKVQSSTQTQLFQDQNGKNLLDYLNENISPDCIARLKLLTQLSSGNFNIENGYVEKLKDTSINDVYGLFAESERYPIPLAFGFDKPRTGIMYEIDHWFVLYKNKLCGAAGLFPVEISYFESETLDPAAFHMFLQTMSAKNNEVPFDYFKMFMKATMVPESNAIQTYEQEPIPGKDEDEMRSTSKKIPIGPAIEKFLDSYESGIKNYNIFRLNGLFPGEGESYATNLLEAIKCILPLDFEGVDQKPQLRDSSLTGGNKKKTVRRKHRNKRSYHKRKTSKHRKSMKKRKTIKRK